MRTKDEIIEKIVNDLPTQSLRSEMTAEEWSDWFKEAIDTYLTEFIDEAVNIMEEERNKCYELLCEAKGDDIATAVCESKADAFQESIELIKSMKP